MTAIDEAEVPLPAGVRPGTQSLGVQAARKIAGTTKTPPQMQGTTSRWLLRVLPWVEVGAGTYRVNRRLTHPVGVGRLACINTGPQIGLVPASLAELPLLRGFDDPQVLAELAQRFRPRSFIAGDVLAEIGSAAEGLLVIAHGKATELGRGPYNRTSVRAVLADGDHLGSHLLIEAQARSEVTVRATTPGTALVLSRSSFTEVVARHETLRAHLQRRRDRPAPALTRHGEVVIETAAGHRGEPVLPGTFVDYELAPREYPMSLAQAVLRMHTRVADLYSHPMDQTEQQLRLTIEAIRERQEHELVNNRDFGLLHNADVRHRIPCAGGPPTPADMDDLLCRRRRTRAFLAHPRAIAAFSRECTRRGLYPETVVLEDRPVMAWRGVPLLPCDKIPISARRTTSILAMRTGAEDQGVTGLRPASVPDEFSPGLSVRRTDIDDRAVASYLVTAYFSVAVLVPDALGVLDHVEV